MSQGYLSVTAIGNVGRDPEMRYTPQGIAVCDFSLAVNKKTGKGAEAKETITWIKCTFWREKAEVVSQYVKKGAKIMVIGNQLVASAYADRGGKPAASLDMTCHEFVFLDNKPQDGAAPARGGGYTESNNQGGEYGDTSDIPF